jgi:membrane protein required for colicin V production
VTQFDLIVILLLSVSGLIGCLRGAAREVMTALAFFLAVVVSLLTLRFASPLFRHWAHPVWLANSLAALTIFVIVYLGVRLLGARLVHDLRQRDHLSLLDRVLGLAIGLIRGIVLLGVFQLVFNAATPAERMPAWIAKARLYPLAVDSGHALRLLAPQGSAVANKLAPALERAVVETSSSPSDQTVENAH